MSLGKNKDFLWLNLKELPYFRAFLRAIEGRFYQDISLEAPVLDLGCGDGVFTRITFNHPLDVGIDPWKAPVLQAFHEGSYRFVVQGSGDHLPFSDSFFASAVSNSVLEHIPDVEAVLTEVNRVLKPGAKFVFCVPNHNFLSNLSVSSFFDHIGIKRLGDAYRVFFNRISRHHHCDSPEIWEKRMHDTGFQLEKWWHYFSPLALQVLEWGHYFGLPALLTQKLFGKWILAPYKWNFVFTSRIVQRYYDEKPEHPQGSYTFYIARKEE